MKNEPQERKKRENTEKERRKRLYDKGSKPFK